MLTDHFDERLDGALPPVFHHIFSQIQISFHIFLKQRKLVFFDHVCEVLAGAFKDLAA
ncbi:hypothetical protein [Butyrivibrio proteoclasticus]|uniref:hypothetical protein n=1 Tax=Butyrivibrio proteoclasticus TaxID=43305 RepID=UPI0015A6BA66|nr:hypothetical protein [Butyrivibrio proteoclasticus]